MSAQEKKCGGQHLFCGEGSASPSAVRQGFYTTPPGCNQTCTGKQKSSDREFALGGARYLCAAGSSNCSFDVLEASPTGTVVNCFESSAASPWPSEALALSAGGGGGGGGATTLQFSMAPASAGQFTVDATSGMLSTARAFDFNTEQTLVADVVITLTQENTVWTDTCPLTITVTDANQGPILANAEFQVDENLAPGTTVGTILAVDPDGTTRFTYEIVDADPAGMIALETPTEGKLVVAQDAVFDFEALKAETGFSIRLNISANDMHDRQPRKTHAIVTVALTDLDDLILSLDATAAREQLSTRGGDTVTLRGSGFADLGAGTPWESVKATYTVASGGQSHTATDCTITASNRDIQCTTVPGIGAGYTWSVQLAPPSGSLAKAATATVSLPSSYGSPHITAFDGAQEIPTDGNRNLTIFGNNMGPVGTVVDVTYESQSGDFEGIIPLGQCTVTKANGMDLNGAKVDQVVCTKLVPGFGGPLIWKTTVGGVRSAGTDPINDPALFSDYAPAVVDRVSPETGPTEGGFEMTINGKNFANTAKVFVNGVDCIVVRSSYREIVVTAPSGVGRDLPVKVTIGEIQDKGNLLFSYLPPRVDSVAPSPLRAQTQGGPILTIKGANFGPKLCAEGAWGGASPASAEEPLPIGKSLCAIRIGNRAPGGERGGGSFDDGGGNGTWCEMVSWDHTEVRCRVDEGAGAHLALRIVAGDVWSVPGEDAQTFTFDPPAVFGVTPNWVKVEGGDEISVNGRNFGPGTASHVPQVFIGDPDFKWDNSAGGGGGAVVLERPPEWPLRARNCLRLSHSTIQCEAPPGYGPNHRVWVTVGNQTSLHEGSTTTTITNTTASSTTANGSVAAISSLSFPRLSYLPPKVQAVLPNPSTATEQTNLRITGDNFGLTETAVRVFFLTGPVNGDIECADATWMPPYEEIASYITCTQEAAGFPAGNHNISVTVANYVNLSFAGLFEAVCIAGWYKDRNSHTCLRCPNGATCQGFDHAPLARPGFIRVNLRDGDGSGNGTFFNSAGEAPRFVPCTPVSACQGNGSCAEGWKTPETLCTQCVSEPGNKWYKLNGECTQCPSYAGLYMALYISAIIIFGIIGIGVVKKGPSVASVAVGVDYYQVLSIFASFNIR